MFPSESIITLLLPLWSIVTKKLLPTDWNMATEMAELTRQLYQVALNTSSLNYAPFNYDGVANVYTSTTASNDSTRAKVVIPKLTTGNVQTKALSASLKASVSNIYWVFRKCFTYNDGTGLMELS